ncbi:MAG: glycosyltransferase [Bacteroides sp.]|nr:glycosyltransferase [Bacteroides sp.]
MKILIITRGFPTHNDPQWGCFEVDQALALQSLGHDVAMISVDGRVRFYWRKLGSTYKTHKDIHTFNIFYFPTAIIRRINYKISLFLEKKMLLNLFEKLLMQWGRPDIIHAHFLPCIYKGVILKEKYNIPLVGTEHWSVINHLKLPKYVQYLGNLSYKNVDTLISVSDSLRKRIFEVFSSDSIIVHNMIGGGNL